MSKIALASNVDGTGTFTIASPNSNSDFTLSLPATTAPILAGSGITLSASAPADTLITTDAGNVGIGTTPLVKMHTFSSNAGTPTTSGSATTGVSARFQNSSVNFDIGTYGSGACFIQPRLIGNNASNFDLVLNPNGGNLLVGATGGSYKLSVTGTVYLDNRKSTGYNASSEATLGVFGASNDAAVNNGAVYNIEWKMFGSASGQYWYANYLARGGSRTLGASCTGTAWANASDIANKEAITTIGYGLDTVMAANPVSFQWKTQHNQDGTGKADVGFIAQEIELLVPEVVSGDDGNKAVSYGALVAVAFKAIQELNAKVDAQAAEIAALKGQA